MIACSELRGVADILSTFRRKNHQLACDAIVLGTLLKGCIGARLWQIPVYPYKDHSVHDILNEIRGLKVLSLCEMNREGVHHKI